MKPIENRKVLGVPATKYPVNDSCAHPECSKARNGRKGAHHIFPRSLITNDSYFVKIEGDETMIIPHVTWLCPEHHDDVEQHRGWIKLEEGEFVWYDRTAAYGPDPSGEQGLWRCLAPLDPQPAGRVKAVRPKRKRKKGADRENRRTISLAGPKDVEKPGLVWDELIERAGEKLDRLMGYDDESRKPSDRSDWYILVDSLNDWLTISDEASQ